MSNTLLIDADVLCYQMAYRNTDQWSWDDSDTVDERVLPEKAVMEVDILIDDLRDRLKGDEVYLILSDREANFRKELEPSYKQNRSGKPRPTLWSVLRDYIEFGPHGFPVRQLPRLEGDDVLGIMATHPKRGQKSIIVSIDKDMKTVPCRLYLFNKSGSSVQHIDRYDAQRFHIYQTLMGDPTDGYTGIPGVGGKKATAVLDRVGDNADLWDAVVETYAAYGLTEDDALLQARMAYILQHGDYRRGGIKLWNPEKLAQP